MSKSITDVQIVPIAEEHVEGFNDCVGIVARERKYLGMTERPSLEASRKRVMSNVEKGWPFYVAVYGDEVLGWCDVGLFDREGRIVATSGWASTPTIEGKVSALGYFVRRSIEPER